MVLKPPTRKLTYEEFIASKAIYDPPTGFEPSAIPSDLFGFQSDIVRWACRRGRAAIFADCGLGKSAMQLAWADQVVRHTSGAVLILAPIGVTHQTVREGQKFGIEVKQVKIQGEIDGAGIYITNYEKLHRFDLSQFVAVVIDESSILKSYDGATRTAIIEASRELPYRLACTATPCSE